jgi:LPXTG-motif cell wall-anchored protein
MFLMVILVAVIALLALWLLASNRGIATKWWEWVIGSIAMLLIVFTVVEFFAAQAEFEALAANYILLIMGVPAIILALAAGLLVWKRNRAAS